MLSIIVPTFNESENITKLASRINEVLKADYEIIFVDDSTDDTPGILEQLSAADDKVRYLHRQGERGLATAVIAGFKMAKGDILTVMDADLQHPPELLKNMLAKIEAGFDMVVPSRFIKGGDDGGLKGLRKLVSRTARLISWIFLKKSRKTTDPMSGFFMMNKSVIEDVMFNPVGWKILLEVLEKGKINDIGEVPYKFCPRSSNQSKMCWKEQLNYLRHVARLVSENPENCRFWKFSAVGCSGVLINLFLFYWLTAMHFPVVQAGILAASMAMFSNFILNSRITWPDIERKHFWKRCLLFYIFCSIGILINGIVLSVFAEHLHLNRFLSQLAGICCATIWNYFSNNRWNWGLSPRETRSNLITDSDDSIL